MPILPPSPTSPEAANPHWVADTRSWEAQQERWRHQDALYRYGEYTMFVLLWQVNDFEAGLVRRCPRCYLAYGEIAEAYKQPAQRHCSNCFGTTFEGGYRAKIVRPAIWDAGALQNSSEPRGDTNKNSAAIQSTSDFRFISGDYVMRGDGTRWQIDSIGVNRLINGFGIASDPNGLLAYNIGEAKLEASDSVVYDIGPDAETLRALLNPPRLYRVPEDFQRIDEIKPRATLL